MIIVQVKLLSAITGETTELARMEICNTGNHPKPKQRGHYAVRTLHGRSRAGLDRRTTQRAAVVEDYPREALHVWNLVARALLKMGYNK